VTAFPRVHNELLPALYFNSNLTANKVIQQRLCFAPDVKRADLRRVADLHR
jgi:hypothetical protein